MNTLLMTVFGILFSIALCCVVKVMILLGLGEPNVLLAEGETYLGWWLTLFFLTVFAGTLAGMVIDATLFVVSLIRKD